MLRKFTNAFIKGEDEFFELFIGDADEISRLYDILIGYNRLMSRSDNLRPLSGKNPKLSSNKEYGLIIDHMEDTFCIVSSYVTKALVESHRVCEDQKLVNIYAISKDGSMYRFATLNGRADDIAIKAMLEELESDEIGIEARNTMVYVGEDMESAVRYMKGGE